MSNMIPSETRHEELAAVAAAAPPGLDPEAVERIHEAFDRVADLLRQIADAIVEILKPIIEWAAKVARRFFEAIAAGIVPRKWLHLAKRAKKARTRKKYRKRIREAVIAFLCTSGEEVPA